MKARQSNRTNVSVVLAVLFALSVSAFPAAAGEGWCIKELNTARDALAQAERDHGTNSYLVVSNLMAFAGSCVDVEDYEMARIAYARAAELQKQRLSGISRDLPDRISLRIIALNRLGQVCLTLRRYDSAEKAFNQSMANSQLVLTPRSEEVKLSRTGFALARAYHMRFEDAAVFYARLLKSCQSAFGEDHSEVARVLEAQVWLYMTMDKISEAEKQARRLVELRDKVMPENHPATATALTMLASVLYEHRDYQEILPLLERSLEIRRKAFGDSHPRTAVSLTNMAELHEDMGNPKKAAGYRAAALAIKK